MSKNYGSGQERVAILGGGLSSLYAYWGCLDAGISPGNIELMVHERIEPAGAVFMYQCPIPLFPSELLSILIGSCDNYSVKQWKENRRTSAHERFMEGTQKEVGEPIWDPTTVIPILWSLIPNVRRVGLFTPEDLTTISMSYGAVICTFPNKETREDYKRNGYIVSIPIYSRDIASQDYICIYNGDLNIPWVRQTIVPGRSYTEYPFYTDQKFVEQYEDFRGNGGGEIKHSIDLKPDTPGLSDAECTENNLFRVGRLAMFRRGYLSHMARYDVAKFVEETL
jgi:hypothetical protein